MYFMHVKCIKFFNFFFRCPIDNGTPVFLVFIAGSQFEKDFLEEVP